ncbi:MAG: hypothetical protein HYT85_11885 [candidate division NC10 bacterium]|nr:hypothetical protein [candidate division NC10 bacterium]
MRDKQGRTVLRMRRHISLLASALLALACGDVGAAALQIRGRERHRLFGG